jgi:DNA polymerase-3 subunit gamma/tau
MSAGALLEDTEPVEYVDETLTVAVPRSLHRDTLSDRRSALVRHLNDLSDRPISNVRFVVDTAPSTTDADDSAPDASLSPRETLQQLRNTYPALDVLFAEFEAEPVW